MPTPQTPFPPRDKPFRTFRLTTYWVPTLSADAAGVPIYDKATGKELLKISKRAKHDVLDTEGSAQLPDGRVIAWTEEGSNKYKVLPSGVLATGTGGRALTPFRSVAVDQGNRSGKQPWKDDVTRQGPLIEVGTRIYIAELDGLKLPDGSSHDGWTTAEDTGSAIYGAHLDLFIGPQKNRFQHADQVRITFDGIEEIPAEYSYGLKKAEDGYRDLRPPPRRRDEVS